jgi:hypothetical protein
LKYKNLLQAVASEAAILVWAPALSRPVTGIIPLGPLYSVNKLSLFHLAGLDTEVFGLLPDLCDFH